MIEICPSCYESVYGVKPSGEETKLTVAEIELIVNEVWPLDVIKPTAYRVKPSLDEIRLTVDKM